MPDSTAVLTALRNELLTAGLIRKPGIAGPLPPLHVEPRDGAPGPGDMETPETDGELVATLRLSTELAEAPFDSFRRRIVVDMVYRSSSTRGLMDGRALDAAVRNLIVERADYGIGFLLDAPAGAGAVLVLQSGIFAGLGPVSQLDGVHTDQAKYVLEVKA